MKTIYKFGYKIDSDNKKWSHTFNELFNRDFSNYKIISEYANQEKNWHETYKEINKIKDIHTFNGFKISNVITGFNRYQEYVYITLVVEGDIIKYPNHKFESFKKKIKNTLNGFVDNFEIPFKEKSLYMDGDGGKYIEFLRLANPVLITDNFKGDKNFEYESSKLKIFYNYDYVNQDNNRYTRVFEQVYIAEGEEAINTAIEHYHSIFVLFHRSMCFCNEVRSIDGPSKILESISNKLNSIWPRERINLFLLNRFLNASLYNKTFFGVLELNAQMNSILSQLKIKQQKTKDKYDKQYERVFYNFGEEDLDSVTYYKKLKEYLYAPYNHRQKLLQRIQEFFEPTDVQIERLRNDNDSKVNFSIQWIMSILSVIIFFWGISTVWYENIINIDKTITDTFMNGIQFIPSYLVILTLVTLICMVVSVVYFLIYNSSLLSKDIKKVIKNEKLELDLLEKNVKEIEEYSKRHKKKRLYLITEMLKMVTTHVILNLDGDCSEVDHFVEIIDRLE